jgi:hypothetical protein
MHTFQYVKQLSSIKDCLFRIKKTDQSNGIEKLHAVDELSKEIDVVLVFIGSDEFHNKGR